MEFQTARLNLRTYRSSDVAALLRYYSDPEVCRYLCHGPWTEADAGQAVDKRIQRTSLSSGGLNFVVEADAHVIGNVAAWFASDREETVELGWVFAREVGGRGYATEAVDALLAMVFATEGTHRAIAQMDARNTASARLAERVGMRREAHFVADSRCGGEWTDTLSFGILRQER